MTQPKVLFALSADFGEYVTASVFSRGQPFSAHYAVPRALAPFIPAGRRDMTGYETIGDLFAIVGRLQPDVVVLASGYLFPVNRIATPEALRDLIVRLQSAGCTVATTDPWFRIWALRPDSRFAIYSLRQGGVDEALSGKMQVLQRFLEDVFRGVPHLFAVPLAGGGGSWKSFFNPAFARQAPRSAEIADPAIDEWLFVLSKEDYVFLEGIDATAFSAALEGQIRNLLEKPRNRLRFIGPPGLARFLAARLGDEPRVEYLPFCDFDAFESAIRRARVVCYWNVISSTQLYCLYYRIPPIFFGKGHQVKVCSGLYEHAVEHLYQGRAPRLLDLNVPLEPDADVLIERLEIPAWLDDIGAAYARLPEPGAVIRDLEGSHVR